MQYQSTFQGAESLSDSNISCWKYRGEPFEKFPLHCHSYYELSYITEGSRTEFFNGKTCELQENSLLFVPPLSIHGLRNNTCVQDLVLQFSSAFLYTNARSFGKQIMLTLSNPESPWLNLKKGEAAEQILQKLSGICYEVESYFKGSNNVSIDRQILQEMQASNLMLQLLQCLVERNFLTFQQSSQNYSEQIPLNDIINHMLSQPKNMPDMKEAAHIAGVSYYHFSRLFQKATGLHYSDYCNYIRIQYAEYLLTNSSLSIAEITAAIGISTGSYFTRLFKKTLGLSPIQYRKKHRSLSHEDTSASMNNMGHN